MKTRGAHAQLETEDDENVTVPNKDIKKLGVFGLASLAFFSVSGSPAGSEDSVVGGGARLALIGFMVMPLVWSIPEALVTAELASTFPHNGGYVVWVNEAFGEQLAYQEGLLKWMAGVLDGAVYPVMMLNYLRKIIPFLEPHGAIYFFALPMIGVLTLAQYCGLEIVGTTSTIVILVTLMPFVVMVAWGIPQIDGDKLFAEKEGDIDWSLLLMSLFWNLNYWDSISTLASEVTDPGRTFPRALALAMLFTVAMYLLSLGVGVGTAPADFDWDNAGLADAGEWIAGRWLKVWIVIAVSISAIGLYLAEVSTDIFMLEGMAAMGMLPKFLHTKNRFDIPVYGLAFQTFLIVMFVVLLEDMETIIAWEMVSYCVAQVLEFAAFIRLRHLYPDTHRPFKSPGGIVACALLVTPATIFTFVLMGLSDWDVWVAGAVQIIGCFITGLLLQWARKRYPDSFMPSDLVLSTTTDQTLLLGSTNSDPKVEAAIPVAPTRLTVDVSSHVDAMSPSSPDFLSWFNSDAPAVETTSIS